MKDFLIVPHTHTFIMSSARVSRQTIHFLREGSFEGNHARELIP
jgi:hypothetical protein